MSAEAKSSPEMEAFAKEFSDYIQEMSKRLNNKYPGKILDMAFIVNWVPELIKEPVPKLIVETFRPQDKDFDPVKQTMEISDLLGYGSQQMVRQLLSIILQQNVLMQQRLSQMADATLSKALGPQAPQVPPGGPKLIVP